MPSAATERGAAVSPGFRLSEKAVTVMKEVLFSPYMGVYLLTINLLAFAAVAADKRRAQKGRWRIPEATLLLLAALGGSPAFLLAMYLFHHKTRKAKFFIGVPLLLLLQLLLLLWLWFRLP